MESHVAGKDPELEKDYWNHFYNKWVIDVPSQFCVQMLTEIDPGQVVVELGSGNGRDSHYLARQGHPIVAMDISEEAIEKGRSLLSKRGVRHASLVLGDVSNPENVADAIEQGRFRQAKPGPLVVYSRFLLHSLDADQERRMLVALGANLRGNDRVFLEFRALEDEATDKIYGDHYRRYVDSVGVRDRLKDELDFNIQYFLTGQGMAKYKEEDPFVTRIIAIKN